jgi:hypothetical protein
MSIVPPLAVRFVKNKELLKRFDLSNVRDILCAAAVLLPDVAAELLEVIPTKSGCITQGRQNFKTIYLH